MYVPDEKRSYELAFVVLGLSFGLVTLWAVVDEAWIRRPWKSSQRAYIAAVSEPQRGVGVQQLVVPALGVVDRCHTCHAGIDDPRLEGRDDLPPELRPHPRRARLFADHPIEQYGCTPCHGGHGLTLTAKGSHKDEDPYWTDPLMFGAFIESRCAACHPGSPDLEGAPRLSAGKKAFKELGCGGCHSAGDGAPSRDRGPALRKVAAKLHPGYLLSWIREPKPRRTDRRMPQFWPAGGPQKAHESLAIAAYLLSSAEPFEAAEGHPEPTEALAEEGRRLFDRIGCRGCHVIGVGDYDTVDITDSADGDPAEDASDEFWGEEETEEDEEAADVPAIDHGPALGDVGARMNAAFIAGWLLDPKAYWPESTMPDLRITRRQAAAVAAFLTQIDDAPPPPTPPELESIDPALAADGKALIGKYGCAGCHDIVGFEDAQRIGPELSAFGDKEARDFYYGDIIATREQRTWLWYTETKLTEPRTFSSADVAPVMPDFELSPEELETLMVYLRGLRSVEIPSDYVHEVTDPAYERGAELFASYNCRGCHAFGDRSGDIARYYSDPHLLPPSLDGEGARVRPQWLFSFLIEARPLRPWLEIQMPTFGMNEDDARALTHFFGVEDKKTGALRRMSVNPFTAERSALGAKFFAELQCVTCHLLDNREGLEVHKLAPDLGLARQRLDPAWVRGFLVDPGAKLPGTNMPQFFPQGQTPNETLLGGDVTAQIDLLVDHVMNIGVQPVDTVRSEPEIAEASP